MKNIPAGLIFFIKCCMVLFIFVFNANAVFAGSVTFQRDYTYQASEADSKISCRAIALEQVKRLLLEELGVYLESETEVKNSKLTRDQITTLTAGIVHTEVIQEKWNGQTYYLKAELQADPENVANSVISLRRNRQKTKELEKSRQTAANALKELENLQKELSVTKSDLKKLKQYNDYIKSLSATYLYEKGSAMLLQNKNRQAIDLFSRAIELCPDNSLYYNNRGIVYSIMGNHGAAIKDYEKALELNPADHTVYSNLSSSYFSAGKTGKAVEMLEKAIKLLPEKDTPWLRQRLGEIFFNTGRLDRALEEYKKAATGIQDPLLIFQIAITCKKLQKYEEAIYKFKEARRATDASGNKFFAVMGEESALTNNIGYCYLKLNRLNEALKFYSESVKINPQDHFAYYNLACIFSLKKNAQPAIEALKKSIVLKPSLKNHAKNDPDLDFIKTFSEVKHLIHSK